MKPKASGEYDEGLLEYLEDIIGTSAYVSLIEDAAKKHEQLVINENEAFSKFKFLQKEKEDCEKAKNDVINLINEENEHIQSQALLLQIESFEAKQNLHQAKNEISQLEEKCAKAKEKCIEEIRSFGEMEIEVAGLEKDLSKKQAGLLELNKDLDAKQKLFIGRNEEKKQLKQQLKKNQKLLEEEKTAYSAASTAITHLTEEIQQKTKGLKEVEASLITAKKSLKAIQDSTSSQTASLQHNFDILSVECLPLKNKAAVLEKSIENASVQLEDLQHEKQKLETSFDVIKSKISAFKNDIDEKLIENESLSAHLNGLEEKISSVSREQSDLDGKASALREKLLTLQDQHEQFSPKSPQNNLLKLFFEAGVEGVHGRLGDLGTIDDSLAVAASIAAGYTLENVVVENTTAAQTCVEILKQKKAGRATFIILDKIKKYSPAGSNDFPAARLVDLIKTEDARYRDAFYHAFKDTLVVENLAKANKIAYGKKRFRVVTEDGKLIDISGTMSGGGTRSDIPVHRIGINKFNCSKADAVSYKETERQLGTTQNELKNVDSLLAQKSAQLEEFLSLKDEVISAIRKNKIEIASCEKAIKALETQSEDHQKQQKNSEEALKRMPQFEAQISAERIELQELQSKIAQFDDKMTEIKNQIMDIGGIEYRTAHSTVNNFTEQYDHLQSRLIKAQTELTINERKISRSKVEELEKLCASVAKDCDKSDSDSQKLQHEIEALTEKQQSASETIAELRSILKSQKEVTQKIEALRSNLSDFEADTKKEIQLIEKRATGLIAKFDNLKTQIDRLKFVTVDDDSDALDARQTEVIYYEDDDLKNLSCKKEQLIQRVNSRDIQFSKTRHLNLHVFAEFKQKNSAYLQAKTEYELERDSREETKQRHDSLKKKRYDEFLAGFASISSRLKEIYQLITMGGNAELELVDSLDPFSEGVIFSVMPPKKSWKNIAHLSGGEKTLSSLALIFALHTYKPTPFYVMDEIDAALDFKNVSIIANYIRERTTGNAQFVVISLRNDMFERADQLVGVFKASNCSHSVFCPLIK